MLNPVRSLRRAEAQLEKQLGSIQGELDKVRGALKLLSGNISDRKTRQKGTQADERRNAASSLARFASAFLLHSQRMT